MSIFEAIRYLQYRRVIRKLVPNTRLLASFPKSGNTWISAAITANEIGFDQLISPEVIRSCVPELERSGMEDHISADRVLKTHLPRFFEVAKAVVLIRDPLVCLAAYRRYLTEEHGKNTLPMSMFAWHPTYGLSAWIAFYKSWLSDDSVIAVKYEDLVHEPGHVLPKIFNWLGISQRIETGQLLRLVSIDRLRKARLTHGDPFVERQTYDFFSKTRDYSEEVNLLKSTRFLQARIQEGYRIYDDR